MSDMQQVTKLMTTHCSNGATIRYERNLKPLEHGEAALYSKAGKIQTKELLLMTWRRISSSF